MKKVLLLSAALLSCLPLAAESVDVAVLTKAVLDNNFREVRQSLKNNYSRQELTSALKMAQEKNRFYYEQVERWAGGTALAVLGAAPGVVLSFLWGLFPHKSINEIISSVVGKKIGPEVATALISASIAAGAVTALSYWTQKNLKKWQNMVNESNWIMDLINKKIKGMPV